HHGEDGPFHRGAERPLLRQRFQKAVDADLLPEGIQYPGAAQRARFDESQTALALQRGLGLQDILGAQEAGDASDQAPELLDVVFVGTAEGIEDAGPGLTGHRIALIVRDLEVGDDGTVFVLALDSSEVHVYIEPYFAISDKHLFLVRVPTRFRDFASLRSEGFALSLSALKRLKTVEPGHGVAPFYCSSRCGQVAHSGPGHACLECKRDQGPSAGHHPAPNEKSVKIRGRNCTRVRKTGCTARTDDPAGPPHRAAHTRQRGSRPRTASCGQQGRARARAM